MGTLADDLMLKVMLTLLLMPMKMPMQMRMLMLLHTSERTIVPQTVIFLIFQPAVTSKRYIRATSPVNTYSSGVKTDFWRKTGRSRAVYESIRKIPTARSTEISVPSQTSIRFFPLMAENGPFRPFFGL